MLPNVRAQGKTMAAGELLETIDRAVRSLTGTVGKTLGDEVALEARLDDRAQGVVHDSVADRRATVLWIVVPGPAAQDMASISGHPAGLHLRAEYAPTRRKPQNSGAAARRPERRESAGQWPAIQRAAIRWGGHNTRESRYGGRVRPER